jgi:hypothetical protein
MHKVESSNLNRFFEADSDLFSKSHELRRAAAADLGKFVELELAHLPSDKEADRKFLKDLGDRILDLLRKAEPNAKLGGLATLSTLIDMKTDEKLKDTLFVRFSNILNDAMLNTQNSPVFVLHRIAEVFGHLVRYSSPLVLISFKQS